MNDRSLPPLAADATPEFIDGDTCKEWLEHLPLANVKAAQQQLRAQLTEFNRFPVKPVERLAVLEALREAVAFVQIEQAKRFTNRALPMAEAENAAFGETVDLWEEMRVGYLRCLDAAQAGEAGMRSQAGLACQRLLAYVGLKMFHFHRAYRQVPPQQFRELHEAYARAEELGVADEAVKDFLNRDVHDTSPRVAYVRALLMSMANPNELAQRQLTFVAFLLERWADKVGVERDPCDEGDVASPVVDLAGEVGPENAGSRAREPRYLDMTRLAKSLRNRVGLLRKGESPAKLALGEDCVQPSCEQILVYLYRQWCQKRPPRSFERSRNGTPAQLCNGIEAIHYYVGGKVFRQPGEQKELTKKQREELATFGRISTRHEDDYSVARGIALENWQLVDESSQGMRLVRPAALPGKRYTHGQLVALRLGGGASFMLGQVRWMMCADNGDFHAGIKLLPGLPAATAVRPTGLNVMHEQWVPALSMTAAEALDSPPALVLPSGWYKPKRVVEVFVDSPVRVRLAELLERGTDYERAAYEMLPD